MQIQKLIFILLLCPLFSYSQKKHTVGAKETLFSIGRLYNVHPRELAEFNNIPFETGLTLGQVIKIPKEKKMAPLPETDVKKPVKNDNDIKSTPIYHTVQKKETLYQISRLYNNVSVTDLKKWNNLSSDGVNEGVKLIVGYSETKAKDENQKEVVKVVEEKKVEKITEIKETDNKTIEAPVENKEEKVENVKAEEKTPVLVDKKEEVKTSETPTTEVNTEKVATIGKDFKGGYFKTAFETQKSAGIEESGMASTFKSTSGWNDGKYYCLHNTAPSGTILKITNKSNKKSVYAKVLDVMPDLKQNSGLLLRISNAAASALEAKENKFEVELSDR